MRAIANAFKFIFSLLHLKQPGVQARIKTFRDIAGYVEHRVCTAFHTLSLGAHVHRHVCRTLRNALVFVHVHIIKTKTWAQLYPVVDISSYNLIASVYTQLCAICKLVYFRRARRSTLFPACEHVCAAFHAGLIFGIVLVIFARPRWALISM